MDEVGEERLGLWEGQSTGIVAVGWLPVPLSDPRVKPFTPSFSLCADFCMQRVFFHVQVEVLHVPNTFSGAMTGIFMVLNQACSPSLQVDLLSGFGKELPLL